MLNKLFQSVAGDGERTKVFYGYGSPENAVVANIGSLYLRKDGGSATSFYVKESGNNLATGWITPLSSSGEIIANGEINIGNWIKGNNTQGWWLGAEAYAAAPFRVSLAGAITAISGSIGGWTIASDRLSYGTDADYIGLIPGTGIQMGDSTFDDAPFSVTNAGALKAVSGLIGGWILASTTLADNAIAANANVLIDKANSLIRLGPTSGTYLTIDGANTRLRTSDYVSGALGSGWNIDTNWAEFNNIRARGRISTTVFEKDVISSIGGSFLVSDSDILNANMTAADNSTLTILGDTTFAVNDILRIKDGIDDEWFTVTNIGSAPTYTVTRDRAGVYSANSNPIWKKGTAVVNYGASGEGLIYMTASDTNAPHIDVLTHAGAPWTTTTTRMRMGNVNGFLGAATDLYGIYIGETNNYLKYDPTNGLQIKGIITAESGSSTGSSNQLLRNGNFEVWTAGTTSAPDGWTLVAGGSVAREGTTIKIGTYSMKVVSDSNGNNISQAFHTEKGIDYWKGKTVTMSCWAWASDASAAYIGIWTTQGSYNSSAHTGGSTWELLSVTYTLPSNATDAYAICYNIGNTKSVYFDGAMLVEGSSIQQFSEKNYSERWVHPSDVTLIDGGDIYTNSITVSKLGTNIFGIGQLINNGNFKDWSAGAAAAPDGFTVWSASTIARETNTSPVVSPYHCKITATSTWDGIAIAGGASNYLTVKPSTTYSFSMYYKVTTGDTFAINIRSFNGAVGGTQHAADEEKTDTSWTIYTKTFTTDADATNLQIVFYAKAATDIVYVCGAMLVEGSYPMPFTEKIRDWGHPSDYTKIDGGDIYTGTITADKITAGTFIGGDFVIGSGGAFQSDNYVADTSGFKLDHEGLEINTGTLRAATLSFPYAASDTLLASANTERTSTAPSYIMKKEIVMAGEGEFRIKFDGDTVTGSSVNNKAKVCRNGVLLYEVSDIATTYTTYSTDKSGWVKGDLCQLWISANSGDTVAIKNFRIYGDWVDPVFTINTD